MNPSPSAPFPDESTRSILAGIAALERGEWAMAESHFAKAGELRDAMPWRGEPESAWMRAAAWLNHGDAVVRAGDTARFPEAIGSFDKAIESMGQVPLGANPALVDRLMLAWMNRGSACGETGDFDASAAAFGEAERLIGEWGGTVSPPRCFLSAMLCVNRARARMAEGRALDAWLDVREGLARFRSLEWTAETVRAGIRARVAGCRALAMLLDEPGGPEKVGDWIAEATDLAEEALALVRASGFRDEGAADLVRYGARIYRACQPRFLGEFLIEWIGNGGPLADDGALKAEMRNELWLAIAVIERDVLAIPHETEFVEKSTAVLKKLQAGLAALG